MGEDQMEAVAWHQLGMVAQEARDWDEAEQCYKQSIDHRESWEFLASRGNLQQLAIVARERGTSAGGGALVFAGN